MNGEKTTKGMEMFKVKLTGHDYRYEVFQILNLFFDKSQLDFNSSDSWDIESVLDLNRNAVECNIYKDGDVFIKKQIKLHQLDKKDIKNAIKMAILNAAEEYTGKKMPWGILVGIRPTKIVHELERNNYEREEIRDYLTSNYHVSYDKALLTIEVAEREKRYLTKKENSVSLYIGIPFCPTRCVYCSFTSNPLGKNQRVVEEYLDALIREITATLDCLNEKNINVDTLYIGGGTPTSLTSEQLRRLFETLSSRLDIKGLREFTVEAGRPDSIDEEKLLAIKEAGCERISINPQTMNDETLRRIGRNHTSEDIVEKYELARMIGFKVINMDLIIGLPGEGVEEIRRTMEKLRVLSPDNVTIHTMAIKRASVLNEREYSDKSLSAERMYEIATEEVRNMGLYPYYMYRQKNMVSPLENVGYCKESTECIYNIQMIAENISIIAMGADGVSKLVFEDENRIERVANVKDVGEYIKRIDEMIENKKRAIDIISK
ncbi:anaerobic coproporphyrinogen III oxidase [Fonticella tunisiensis]|uniref:Anaerobic coproporphyrinogen III oxidase n=2 Tax=Fonticella tunisiensis TaxID=1096341 RepID=A0A4R7K4A8_9CLOT|nr:anaerobic coproporphyrinogen III oxidase [Fonticella tunisiensis]